MNFYSSPMCPYKGDRVIADRICRIAIFNARKMFDDVLCVRNKGLHRQVQQDVAVATLLIPVGVLILDRLTTIHKDGELYVRYVSYGRNLAEYFSKCIVCACGRDNVSSLMRQFAEHEIRTDTIAKDEGVARLCPIVKSDLCCQFVIDVLSRVSGYDLRADKDWLREMLMKFYAEIVDGFLPAIDYFVERRDKDVDWDNLPVPVMLRACFENDDETAEDDVTF